MRKSNKNSFESRLYRSLLFRAQAVFFGRLAISSLYLILFILSITNKNTEFPNNFLDLGLILAGIFYAVACYKIKNQKKALWWHLITLFFDLVINIYFTKNSGFLLSPLMALHPLFTAMFILLFHNPLIIAVPLVAIPMATIITLLGSPDPPFIIILGRILLFCCLDALTIFFIQLVQSQEQRMMYSLVSVEKKLRTLAILKERQRFAQDFHDGIGSQLTSVIMQVDYLQAGLKPHEPLHQELSDIKAGALSSIDDMRRSIAFLQDDFDVAEQVALLCENLHERHRINIQTHGIYHLADLKPEQQVACCRVVQESLNNALKHAQASLITISCLRDHGLIKLYIEDNGIGFSCFKSPKNHYGLSTMQNRARQIGGALAIISEAKCGTRVELAIPC